MNRFFASAGAISAFIAVAAGAFGAHALKVRLEPDMMAVFETGARYQMYHAIALFVAAHASSGEESRRFARWAGWAFLTGTVLFSGSLYLLALSGIRMFGAVTPLGGLAFLLGWVFLFFAFRRG
jgi:uncharacterized membrane protein YgdD (TMEM256/DUF423 family)